MQKLGHKDHALYDSTSLSYYKMQTNLWGQKSIQWQAEEEEEMEEKVTKWQKKTFEGDGQV